MTTSFSSLNRKQLAEDFQTEEFDLLIIGGGITGAGILLDAASRGIRAGLIEMQDFAAGTSSRSTKLVHGGLRYLKQFEVGLVAEVGKERAIVYENAPHVTTPIWMLLPIVEGGTFGRLSTSIGISVYDWLAGVKKTERKKMLSKEEAVQKEPLLRREGLKGAGYYVEYRTDDARLTLEVMKEAVRRGAKALNYVRAEDLLYEGKLIGITARDLIQGKTFFIRAKKIVNATGPWVDELREKDKSKNGKYLHHTKGVHIVIDKSRFPLHNAVYFDVADGRMVFAIPRGDKAYVGTTDTDYHEDLSHPRLTKQDVDYILNAINSMFPTLKLTSSDVETGWAGIRPLIHEEGKSPSKISRKDEVFVSQTGLITIAGGKLTGYRKMAQTVTDLVANALHQETGAHFPNCFTEKIRLSGGDIGNSGNWDKFVHFKVGEGVQLGLSTEASEWLVRLYGANVEFLYETIAKTDGESTASALPADVYAAVMYSIESEMCETMVDFFLRRTGTLLFDIQFVRQWRGQVEVLMADVFGWDKAERLRQHLLLDEAIGEATVTL